LGDRHQLILGTLIKQNETRDPSFGNPFSHRLDI
jgi:hypothetical protein